LLLEPRRPGRALGVVVLAALAAFACLLLYAASQASARARTHARGRSAPRQACAGASLVPGPGVEAQIAAATLCLIDEQRRARRLRPLHSDGHLAAVAREQLQSMVSLDYFADVGPSGQTPLTAVAHSPYAAHAGQVEVGQDLGWGAGPWATPAGIVAAWMASPPHRRIMLGTRFRDAGAASSSSVPALLAPRGGAIYAVEFGARL
jgi:uncharacterized protein YkwD